MKHRVPPFPHGPASGGEYLTKEGAERLGQRVQAAWRAVGHEVPYSVQMVIPGGRHGKDLYAPRFPTLINGLPT